MIGFMGCGKSYLGQKLAQHSHVLFIDLDDYITQKEGRSIARIFEENGAETFRNLEQKYLQSLENESFAIVACGGGTPCYFDNMRVMQEMGRSIFLSVPPLVLFERLLRGREHRPLLAHLSDAALMDFIEKKLAERLPFYQKADITLEWPGDDEAFFGLLAHCGDLIKA